jgi:hypothetical protein
MAGVLVRLGAATAEEAQAMAQQIRNQGTINYTDASGSTVNVEVGDVTVEDSS